MKGLQTVYIGECPRCKHYDTCIEQRGICRDYIDYETIKEKVRDEISALNESGTGST